MSVLVVFDGEAASGKEDQAIALIAEMFPDTRRYDGCASITLHRDQDAPARFVMVERWMTKAQYEDYLQWRIDRGDVDRLGALLAGPPVIRYFDDVDA